MAAPANGNDLIYFINKNVVGGWVNEKNVVGGINFPWKNYEDFKDLFSKPPSTKKEDSTTCPTNFVNNADFSIQKVPNITKIKIQNL